MVPPLFLALCIYSTTLSNSSGGMSYDKILQYLLIVVSPFNRQIGDTWLFVPNIAGFSSTQINNIRNFDLPEEGKILNTKLRELP